MAAKEIEVQAEEVRGQALAVVEQSQALMIVDQGTYDLAVDDRANLKRLLDQIDEKFEEPIRKAFEAHRAMTGLRNELKAPVEARYKERNLQLAAWTEEQAEIRRQEEQRLLEKARLEAEKKRQRELKAAQKKGYDQESLEAIAAQPLEVAPVQVADQYLKSDKIVDKEIWSGEVVDLWALVRFVAKHKHMLHLLEAVQKEVNSLAKSQRAQLEKNVPGLRAVRRTSIADKPGRKR